MFSSLFRSQASALHSISRCFSSAPRRLMKKGVVSPINPVPAGIMRPYDSFEGKSVLANQFSILNDYQIEGIRQAGRIAKKVCEFAGTLVKPGVTLDYIDKTTHEFACSLGFYPSCLGKDNFPKSISISVNEVVCHAIPDDSELVDGDIVKIDLVMYVYGFHGDTCRTFECGSVDEKGKHLIKTTKECLDKAISICKTGVCYDEIGKVIYEHAVKNGFDVVRDFVGHGIGKEMHMQPPIFHFPVRMGGEMMRNQVFTIEPMLVEGSHKLITWEDGWAQVTKDNGRSAQFEHTIIIKDDGAEILTSCVCSINNEMRMMPVMVMSMVMSSFLRLFITRCTASNCGKQKHIRSVYTQIIYNIVFIFTV